KPLPGIDVENDPAPLDEHEKLPRRDRREPDLVAGRAQGPRDPPRESLGLHLAPDPDVRVQQEPHFFDADSTDQSPGPVAGATMSPVMRPVPRIEPSHSAPRAGGDGGTTSATGLPKRVIWIGLPVRRTRARTARHVALNF